MTSQHPSKKRNSSPSSANPSNFSSDLNEQDLPLIVSDEKSVVERSRKRNRKSSRNATGWAIGGCLLLLIAAGAYWSFRPKPQPVVMLETIGTVQGEEHSEIRIVPELTLERIEKSDVSFTLKDAPAGVKLDEETGILTWTPSEDQGPGQYPMRLIASVKNRDDVQDSLRFLVDVHEVFQPPKIQTVAPQQVDVGTKLSLSLQASDPDLPATPILWKQLSPASLGITVEEENGLLEWFIDRSVKPGELVIEIEAFKKEHPEAKSTLSIPVTIIQSLSPLQQLSAKFTEADLVSIPGEKIPDSDFRGEGTFLSLNGKPIQLFHYAAEPPLKADLKEIAPDLSRLFGKEMSWKEQPHCYSNHQFIAIYEGEDQAILAALKQQFGSPYAVGKIPMKEPVKPVAPVGPSRFEEELLTRYEKGKLFLSKEYDWLRKEFAQQFEEKHEAEIRQAFGSDYEEMMTWFQGHQELKEELFLAIQPDADHVLGVLQLFHEIRKQHPDQIAKYGQLAIAIAVTWDKTKGSVYDYAGHQRRTKSSMPDQLLDALGNFEYFLKAEKVMQGRAQFLPWEFQTLLVNHKTPATEREWAVSQYLPKRSMIGKCYSEVPYDNVMLQTKSETCRLAGKEYNLPNILSFGGVCAMQADFASRVGKNLGVPAAYVSGQSRYGESHAWVMWVELMSVTPRSIRFKLESHGRYRGDHYYVGHLNDPQTGKRITDRQLELQLQVVGSGPQEKRQADLLLQALPIIEKWKKLSPLEKVQYLQKVISLSPGHQQAWREIALLSNSADPSSSHHRLYLGLLNKFFSTFAAFPDFTAEIFEQLIQFEDKTRVKTKYYERLIGMYASAQRPDLASDARMKQIDYLLKDIRKKEAINGLAGTILAFAAEGRFVVKMLDRLESLASELPGSEQDLITFYTQFLPKIPRKRGSRSSDYCIKMYERGIDRFQKLGRNDLAAGLQIELNKLKNGS